MAILSSSVRALEDFRSTSTRIYANASVVLANPLLARMIQQLEQWRMLGSAADADQFTACQTLSAGLDARSRCVILERSLSGDYGEYQLLVTPLRTPGVQWFVAIAALKSDFDGGLGTEIRKAITYGAIVLAVAAVMTCLIAFLITRPFRRMAWFFAQLSEMLQKSSVDSAKSGSTILASAPNSMSFGSVHGSDPTLQNPVFSSQLAATNAMRNETAHQQVVQDEDKMSCAALCMDACFPRADFSTAISEVRIMQDGYQKLLTGEGMALRAKLCLQQPTERLVTPEQQI